MTALNQLVQVIHNKHIYIQTHNYPDPDALASARGLQVLLEHCNISSTICYKGHIDKFNTLKMLELLHIEIIPGKKLPLRDEDEIILVDCQKGNQNVNDFTGDEIACIDHHQLQPTSCYRFFDIQTRIGACSTIIAHYFIENNIPLSAEIATVLLYGIKMDTANLSRSATDLDVDMFSMLFKKSDKTIIRQLDSSSLKRSDLTAYVKAIEDLRIYENIAFANIGNNCSEAIIATLGDFILTLNEVVFVMVYSYRAGGLKLSVRSEIPDYDSADVIKKALFGYGDGGGHSLMAAGFIPNIATGEEAVLIASVIEDRVMEILGEN